MGPPLEFVARLLQLSRSFPPGWDLVSLLPTPGLCARARWLPWYPDNELIHPRLAFSRTTALVFSPKGVQTLLRALPADNTVDMWYRRLMRAGELDVYIHCGGLVTLSPDAAIPVVRRAARALLRQL